MEGCHSNKERQVKSFGRWDWRCSQGKNMKLNKKNMFQSKQLLTQDFAACFAYSHPTPQDAWKALWNMGSTRISGLRSQHSVIVYIPHVNLMCGMWLGLRTRVFPCLLISIAWFSINIPTQSWSPSPHSQPLPLTNTRISKNTSAYPCPSHIRVLGFKHFRTWCFRHLHKLQHPPWRWILSCLLQEEWAISLSISIAYF